NRKLSDSCSSQFTLISPESNRHSIESDVDSHGVKLEQGETEASMGLFKEEITRGMFKTIDIFTRPTPGVETRLFPVRPQRAKYRAVLHLIRGGVERSENEAWARRVLAREGWAGEKDSVFNSLLIQRWIERHVGIVTIILIERLEDIGPDAGRIFVKDQAGVRRNCDPGPDLHFGLQLSGTPACVAEIGTKRVPPWAARQDLID